LGEKNNLLAAHVSKILEGPSSEKYSSELTNTLVRSKKESMTPPAEAQTPILC
jgi:hypothetical protein